MYHLKTVSQLIPGHLGPVAFREWSAKHILFGMSPSRTCIHRPYVCLPQWQSRVVAPRLFFVATMLLGTAAYNIDFSNVLPIPKIGIVDIASTLNFDASSATGKSHCGW